MREVSPDELPAEDHGHRVAEAGAHCRTQAHQQETWEATEQGS